MNLGFYCEACSHRADAGGDCPNCEDEVLLDLADPDVRMMLQEMDAAAIRRRSVQLGAGAAVAAALPALVFGIWVQDGRGIILLWLVLAVGGGFVLTKLFGLKPRHADV
ncbi:MAG: hypothetical protein GY884_35915 [Proteobacteria bacterium]|nr:hypothetical protein [Pseudomonadota bacterium]